MVRELLEIYRALQRILESLRNPTRKIANLRDAISDAQGSIESGFDARLDLLSLSATPKDPLVLEFTVAVALPRLLSFGLTHEEAWERVLRPAERHATSTVLAGFRRIGARSSEGWLRPLVVTLGFYAYRDEVLTGLEKVLKGSPRHHPKTICKSRSALEELRPEITKAISCAAVQIRRARTTPPACRVAEQMIDRLGHIHGLGRDGLATPLLRATRDRALAYLTEQLRLEAHGHRIPSRLLSDLVFYFWVHDLLSSLENHYLSLSEIAPQARA